MTFGGPSAPEHEIKLVTPAARGAIVATWLRGRCLPDPAFPGGGVQSLYFDDRDLSRLRSKVNSDFLKEKLRVRWYGAADMHLAHDAGPHLAHDAGPHLAHDADPHLARDADMRGDGPAFLEIKRKIGARRAKLRVPVSVVDARAAAAGDSGAAARLLAPLRELDGVPLTDVQPFLHISFQRRRFIEPDSGARVAVDRGIRARSAHPGLLPLRHPAPLAHAVVEIKGPHERLPPRLSELLAMGCRRESFSKYARCYQKIARRSSF